MIIEDSLEDIFYDDWLDAVGYDLRTNTDVSLGGDDEGRTRYSQVVLRNRLENAVNKLNPDLTREAKEAAVNTLAGYANQSIEDGNREVYDMLRGGVPVEVVQDDGHRAIRRAQVIDFETPTNNDFLAVRQFTVHGHANRRPDVVLFVNGLPLVVIELKNPADETATIEDAYNQIQAYKSDIPQLFHFNLINVISDGINAKYGSLTAPYGHYSFWRLLDGEVYRGKDRMELDVLAHGLLNPVTLLDMLNRFVAYKIVDGTPSQKIVAKWHQYQGVLKALERAWDAFSNRKDGKGGVIWFTQGSGKSFLALFYAMALRSDKRFNAPTIVGVTDRNDLDDQLYEDFATCSGSLKATPQKAESRKDLQELLSNVTSGGVFFTTINKFEPAEDSQGALCGRSNVIVIVDEAHRTQYGFTSQLDTKTGEQKYGLAKYMRDALPNAIYLGMTGTPVSLDDRDTESVFGTYVDIYDMSDAQADNAVVPIHYESRIIELSYNKAEENEIKAGFEAIAQDDSTEAKNQAISAYTRLEAVATAEGRLETLAKDLIDHWAIRRETMPACKAMVVAISRGAAVELYDEIIKVAGDDWHSDDLRKGKIKIVMTGTSADPASFHRHRTTKEEQAVIKARLRDPDDELQMVIVRDMWLTGFDAPPLNTMYIDKPMRGHGLMQAIARVNRVWRDKPGGLVVDYIGLGEELKAAIKSYTRDTGGKKPTIDVSGEALIILLDTIDVIRQTWFSNFDYSGFNEAKKALLLLRPAMEHVLEIERKKTEEINSDKHDLTVKSFLDTTAQLRKAQALAGTHKEAIELREEISFFLAVAASFKKYTAAGETTSQAEKEHAMKQLVAKSVLVEGVQDLFGSLGQEHPDISILDDAFLEQVKAMPEKNLALELLQRLLKKQIKSRGRKNAMQGAIFTEKMRDALARYNNRALTTVEVLQELVVMAIQFRESGAPDGMSEEEWAFYQALETNTSAVEQLGHPVLRALAVKLTDQIKRSTTIDWQQRGDARARMRVMVKRLLMMHRYPPDNQEEALERVINQAECLADDWGVEQP